MKVPKISVILPCYNVAPYIGKCLDSLLAQTLSDIEIICVDDKSTDDTADVIASYASRDSRIKVFGFDKNQGVAAARNYGQKRAKAKYIAFVDPDDWLDADFYEKLYDALLNSDADFVVSNIREISIDNKCFEHTDWLQSVSQNKLNFNYTLWCALYRKSFLVDNKIDNPVGVITSQDTVFVTKCAVLANRIITVPNAYYNYIRRDESLSSAFLSDVKIDSKITAAKLILDFLNSTAISPTDYHHVYSIIFKHIVLDYFTRTTKYETRLKLMSAALELFNHMKHKGLFLSSMPDIAPYLICSDTAGLYDYNLKLSQSNRPEKMVKKIKLFNAIPIARVKYRPDYFQLYVLGLPFLTIKTKR